MKEDDQDPRFDALLADVRARDGLSDPRWEALARGELSEDEAAALAEKPPRAGTEMPPHELFRPLDRAERSALADGVFAALDAKKQGDATATPGASEQADQPDAGASPDSPSPEASSGGAKVIPLAQATVRAAARPGASRRRFAVIAALLAAALGAALLLRPPGPAPLALYQLSVEGGDQSQRGDPPSPQDVLRLDPASRLELALRPATPVSGAIAVRGFLVRDGLAQPWDAPALVGAGGVVRIEGTAAALFGDIAEGTWEIVLAIGRPDALPDDAVLLRAAVSGEGVSGLSMHRLRIALSRPHGEAGEVDPGGGRIVFAGCAEVRQGGGCALGPGGTLRFFVPAAAPAMVRVQVDGATVEARGEAMRGGARLSVAVPPDARIIRVTVTAPGDARSLVLSTVTPDRLTDALAQAQAARRQGQLDQAESLVRGMLVDAEPAVRRVALRQMARIQMARGRFDEAAPLLREAIALDRHAGRVSDELDDTFALAYGLVLQTRRFSEARALLEGIGAIADECPEAKPKAAYYRGLIAMETGDLRAALAACAEAAEGAERLGLDDYRSVVLELEAEVLAVLGRHADAAARMAEAQALVGPSADACRKAQLATNRGWSVLRAAMGAGDGPAGANGALEGAKAALEEALDRARAGCPAGLANVLVNLSLVEIEQGDAAAARSHLSEARRTGGFAELAGWQQMLEARILLLEGKHRQALAAQQALQAEGERLLLPELTFAGALGRAEALEALGRPDEARSAHAQAAQALAVWARGAPLGEGRATFLSARSRGARERIDFLLREAERGDASAMREAMIAARRSLGAVTTALRWVDQIGALPADARRLWDDAVAAYRRERAVLDERAASRGPGAASMEAETSQLRAALERALSTLGAPDPGGDVPLPDPAAGEVLLVFHPVRHGLAGLAMADEGRSVQADRLGTVDPRASPAALAGKLLAPFEKALSSAARLRLVVPAELFDIDWQALPLGDGMLLDRMEVVYSLDRPSPSGASIPAGGGAALVISDPTEDLPGARASAVSVVGALETRGMRVVRLEGRRATHEAVRDAIEQPSVRLLHYAGHAAFAGPDGLEAALWLSRRGRLSAADVLALAHVPEIVVLAGCETARIGHADTSAGGLGLAQAFLMKGSRVVLAAPRPIGDALADKTVRLLYARAVERDPVAALRSATLALRAESPAEDWSVLRALL